MALFEAQGLHKRFGDRVVLESIDLAFEAEDGARTPQDYQGLVVAGGGVTTLVVSDVVTLRQELSTSVVVRAGRVVAEQLQIIDEAEGFPSSIAAMLGAPSAAPVWILPDGIGAESYQERIVVFNPGDQTAEVTLTLPPATPGPERPDRPDRPDPLDRPDTTTQPTTEESREHA